MQSKGKVMKSIRVISFMLVLTLLLLSFSYMLAPKDNTAKSGINNPNANGFFSEPANSIDVAVIGNSDAYSGFSPMELWNKYGYTSYVSAEGRQTVSKSYSQLKNILTCHTPKVVILETDGFYTHAKFSQAVVNIFNASMGSSFSIFQYHDRWKRAKLKELLKKPEYTAHCATKGQMLSNDIKGYMGGEYMVKTDKKQKIPMATKTSLEAFIKLCNSNNIQLVFLELPSESSWNYAKHNAVQEIADQNNIPFLDMNIDRDKFEFDWTKDTRDGGNHLNNCGARKATLFIGDYLNRNYKLTDHRSDNNFSLWHQDFNDYKKQVRI